MDPSPEALVAVVSRDGETRARVEALAGPVARRVEAYDSVAAFLRSYDAERPGCLVLDLSQPVDVEDGDAEPLAAPPLPVVFLAGPRDVPRAVRELCGPLAFFVQKPPGAHRLLRAVERALERDTELRSERQQRRQWEQRLRSLTPREREVMEMLVRGSSNKEIGDRLGISARTVEIHRARVMSKSHARSLCDLVRMHLATGERPSRLGPPPPVWAGGPGARAAGEREEGRTP